MRNQSDFHYGQLELVRFWNKTTKPVREMVITLIRLHDENRLFRILDLNNVVIFQKNSRNGWSLAECEKWMLAAGA